MESRFGSDFGRVKVHSDSTSVQMNRELKSQAFTVGNNIFFNSGHYNPGSSKGKHMLSHELTHVLQQNGNDNTIQKEDEKDRYEAATEEAAPASSISPDAIAPIIDSQIPLFDFGFDTRLKLLYCRLNLTFPL